MRSTTGKGEGNPLLAKDSTRAREPSRLGQEGVHRRLASFAVGIGGVCLAALGATVFVMTRGQASFGALGEDPSPLLSLIFTLATDEYVDLTW
jgi:hypothetical protein